VTDKPYAPACDRNRDPILAVLREYFADRKKVLEIGSGTGQHAVHFAAAMPWLTWQCADVAENLPGIRMWLEEAELANTPAPLELDVRGTWPTQRYDAVFSANALHIMGWPEVEAFFAGVDRVLADPSTSQRYASFDSASCARYASFDSASCARYASFDSASCARYAQDERQSGSGVLAVYGPFNYGGSYTSDSNREFDGWLKARDPRSGIRAFEAVDALACRIGLVLVADVAMPANNRTLVWRR